jgi:hypothetical protein
LLVSASDGSAIGSQPVRNVAFPSFFAIILALDKTTCCHRPSATTAAQQHRSNGPGYTLVSSSGAAIVSCIAPWRIDNMRSGIFLLLIGASILMQAANAGENLTIPGHEASDQTQMLPKRGISMDAVLSEFGEPEDRFGPVGDPAITEWVYGSFRVYFEDDTVLHAIDLNTIIMPKQ